MRSIPCDIKNHGSAGRGESKAGLSLDVGLTLPATPSEAAGYHGPEAGIGATHPNPAMLLQY